MRSQLPSLCVVARLALVVALCWASANAHAGPAFVTVDPQDDRAYRYDEDGAFVESFGLVVGNDNAVGIAVHDNVLHVFDRRSRRIYQYGTTGELQAVSRELRQTTGNALSTVASAVAIDGNELWVLDRGRDKLLGYVLGDAFEAGAPLPAAQEIPLAPPNARAEGLAIDPTHLYVLDHIDRRLYRYRRDGGASGDPSRVMAEVDGDGTRAPYGVARSGDSVLVVDASRDKVYTYDLSALFSGSGPLAASAETRLDLANGNARDVAAFEAPDETTTTTTGPTGNSSTVTLTTATSSTTDVGATTSTTETTLPKAVPAFLTVDPQDRRVYRYDDAGALTGSFSLVAGNDHASGLTLHEGILRVLDGTDSRIYEYDPSGGLLGVSRELRRADGTTFGTTAGAVAIDGDDLWIVDRGDGKLFRYSLEAAFETGVPLPAAQEITLDPANARAEGLAIDGTHLYVLDQIDRQLYRYRRDGTDSVSASGIMTGIGGTSLGAPYGVTRSGESVLVVDASRDAVFRYELAALFGSGEQVAASAEAALDAANDDARDVASADD